MDAEHPGADHARQPGAHADEVNVHHYMDGSRPTYAHRSINLTQAPKRDLDLADMVADMASVYAPGARITITETGCRATEPGVPPTNFNPTEEVAANYIIQLLFEFYRLGAKRTFIYSIVEEIDVNEEPWGLYANRPGFIMVPRPSYFAVQRTIALFGDPARLR